jgi:hypothetical protein
MMHGQKTIKLNKNKTIFFSYSETTKIMLIKPQNMTFTKTTQYTEMAATVENVIVSESSNEETHPIRTVCEKKYW